MPVVSISGLTGCGSTAVSKLLAKRLGISYFSVGNIFRQESPERKNISKALDVWMKKGREKEFHHKIDEMQRKVARCGNVVVDGKLSVYFLKAISDSRIWLKADIERRAERLAISEGIATEIAMQLVKEKDKIERSSWLSLYNIDLSELENHAQIVIDTTYTDLDDIVNKILRMSNF